MGPRRSGAAAGPAALLASHAEERGGGCGGGGLLGSWLALRGTPCAANSSEPRLNPGLRILRGGVDVGRTTWKGRVRDAGWFFEPVEKEWLKWALS